MSGTNCRYAAAPAERFDPFIEHKLVLDKTTRQATAKVDLPLVYKRPSRSARASSWLAKAPWWEAPQEISCSVITPLEIDSRNTSPTVMRAM